MAGVTSVAPSAADAPDTHFAMHLDAHCLRGGVRLAVRAEQGLVELFRCMEGGDGACHASEILQSIALNEWLQSVPRK